MRHALFRLTISLLGLAAVLTLYTAWGIGSFASGAEVAQADAAWGDEPSPVCRERINHGVTLYRQGTVRALILTGGRPRERARAESEVARAYAVRQGVPEAAILVETRSHITEKNLAYAPQMATAHGLGSFFIVSDPLHMPRAILMARDLGMEAYPLLRRLIHQRGDHRRAIRVARLPSSTSQNTGQVTQGSNGRRRRRIRCGSFGQCRAAV